MTRLMFGHSERLMSKRGICLTKIIYLFITPISLETSGSRDDEHVIDDETEV